MKRRFTYDKMAIIGDVSCRCVPKNLMFDMNLGMRDWVMHVRVSYHGNNM